MFNAISFSVTTNIVKYISCSNEAVVWQLITCYNANKFVNLLQKKESDYAVNFYV